MHFIDVEFGCGRGRALGARGVESVGECARYRLDQWRGSDSRRRRSRGPLALPPAPNPAPGVAMAVMLASKAAIAARPAMAKTYAARARASARASARARVQLGAGDARTRT